MLVLLVKNLYIYAIEWNITFRYNIISDKI